MAKERSQNTHLVEPFSKTNQPKKAGRPKGAKNKLVSARDVLIKEGFNPIEAMVHLFMNKDNSKYFGTKQKKLTPAQQLQCLDLISKYALPQHTRVEVEGNVQQKLTFAWDTPAISAQNDETLISIPEDAVIDVQPIADVVEQSAEQVQDMAVDAALKQLHGDDPEDNL